MTFVRNGFGQVILSISSTFNPKKKKYNMRADRQGLSHMIIWKNFKILYLNFHSRVRAYIFLWDEAYIHHMLWERNSSHGLSV